MNVSLTPELDKFVQDLVAGGSYQTASEVVREGLRLLQERQELHQRKVERARAKIQLGLDQIKRGEYLTNKEVRDHFRKRSEELRRKRA